MHHAICGLGTGANQRAAIRSTRHSRPNMSGR
jgi:hypothetical protein